MAFELWSKDSYGQGSIIGRFTDLGKLVDRARKEVNDINVENPLTVADKQNSWEAYFVEVVEDGQPSMQRIYAGNNPDNKHRINVIDNNASSLHLMTDADEVRIYLGYLDGETWYAKNKKGGEINSLFSKEGRSAIEDKTVFFARVI